MAVLRMVLLVLLEPFELFLEVANLGHVPSGPRRFDLGLVLLDVLVDVVHSDTGWLRPELIAAHHTGADRRWVFVLPAADLAKEIDQNACPRSIHATARPGSLRGQGLWQTTPDGEVCGIGDNWPIQLESSLSANQRSSPA